MRLGAQRPRGTAGHHQQPSYQHLGLASLCLHSETWHLPAKAGTKPKPKPTPPAVPGSQYWIFLNRHLRKKSKSLARLGSSVSVSFAVGISLQKIKWFTRSKGRSHLKQATISCSQTHGPSFRQTLFKQTIYSMLSLSLLSIRQHLYNRSSLIINTFMDHTWEHSNSKSDDYYY